jgi:hypothetical protein
MTKILNWAVQPEFSCSTYMKLKYGGSVFDGCSKLPSIAFDGPSELTTIPDCAFCDCSCLTTLTLPDSVTAITHRAVNSGIVIQCRLHPTNARSPIVSSLDDSSKLIVSSSEPPSKHRPPTISTDSGAVREDLVTPFSHPMNIRISHQRKRNSTFELTEGRHP